MDYLYFFILGISIGSFLNVIIYRIPIKKSIVRPPSHCTVCNKRLKALDLIPILSWVLLKGRCRYCKSPISYRYPFIELLTGLIFVFTYSKLGLRVKTSVNLLIICLLIVDTFIDFDHYLIPDSLNIFAAISFLLINIFFPFTSWTNALLGSLMGAIPLLLLVLLTGGKGMGMGDVKLMAVLGLFLGWKYLLLTLLLSFILGGAFSLVLLITKIKSRKDVIPFGPWISMATFITLFWGEIIVNWYLSLILF